MNNATILRACAWRYTVIFSLFFFCSGAFAQEVPMLRMEVPSSIESSGPHLIKPC